MFNMVIIAPERLIELKQLFTKSAFNFIDSRLRKQLIQWHLLEYFDPTPAIRATGISAIGDTTSCCRSAKVIYFTVNSVLFFKKYLPLNRVFWHRAIGLKNGAYRLCQATTILTERDFCRSS